MVTGDDISELAIEFRSTVHVESPAINSTTKIKPLTPSFSFYLINVLFRRRMSDFMKFVPISKAFYKQMHRAYIC